MDKVVHFELPADDMNRAKTFYETAFGWTINAWDKQYFMAATGPMDQMGMGTEPGYVNGGIMQRTETAKTPVLVINVMNLDESIKKVETAGGKVVEPKRKIDMIGFYARVADSEGNVIGLMEAAKQG